MNQDELMRRIGNGEPVADVVDDLTATDRVEFDRYLRDEGRSDLADKHAIWLRDFDLGIIGARSTWHSISDAQRRTLEAVVKWGPRLTRSIRKYYFIGLNPRNFKPAGIATIRNLCARDLMAWDGGAFDPEAAAVVTERGRFVVKHGDASP